MPNAAKPKRRRVRFRSLDQILPEVRRLRPANTPLRRWSLAQVCRHLADTIHGSMDGFDMTLHAGKPLWERRVLLWVTFALGIPEGVVVDPKLTPPEGLRLDDGIAALDNALARYQRHTGPLRPHPLFGHLSRREWDRLHRVHAAHHLGFIASTTGAS